MSTKKVESSFQALSKKSFTHKNVPILRSQRRLWISEALWMHNFYKILLSWSWTINSLNFFEMRFLFFQRLTFEKWRPTRRRLIGSWASVVLLKMSWIRTKLSITNMTFIKAVMRLLGICWWCLKLGLGGFEIGFGIFKSIGYYLKMPNCSFF